MAIELWNERSTMAVRCEFLDEDDLPVVPTLAQYRIDDVKSQTTIRDLADFDGPLAATKIIEVTEDENRIISDARFEERQILVYFEWATDRSRWDRLRYLVQNFSFAPAGSP